MDQGLSELDSTVHLLLGHLGLVKIEMESVGRRQGSHDSWEIVLCGVKSIPDELADMSVVGHPVPLAADEADRVIDGVVVDKARIHSTTSGITSAGGVAVVVMVLKRRITVAHSSSAQRATESDREGTT